MKIKSLVLSIFLLLLTVGCRDTTLTCTRRMVDSETTKADQEIKLVFDKKELKSGTLTIDYYFLTDPEVNANSMRRSLENQFAIYDDKKGISYSVSDIDQGVRFQLKVKTKNLALEDKENLSMVVGYDSYRDASDTLIQEGYTCK